MTCYEALADTGPAGSLRAVLALGVLCLVLSSWIVLRALHRRNRVATPLVVLVLLVSGGAALGLAAPTPAQATPTGCWSAPGPSTGLDAELADNRLTITQTSVMHGLAPAVAPVPITGRVVNHGPDSTFITAISVEVIGVQRAAGSATGRCDASDYRLHDIRMPVGVTLEPLGGSAEFSGASIGFHNKSTNQDACQGATVQLRYRTVKS